MGGSQVKAEKTAGQLYQEREKRVSDAIQLKVPDRVPIVVSFGYFPTKYTGITCEDVYYDYGKRRMAVKKTVLDFEPDMYRTEAIVPGATLEALDCKQIIDVVGKGGGFIMSPQKLHG